MIKQTIAMLKKKKSNGGGTKASSTAVPNKDAAVKNALDKVKKLNKNNDFESVAQTDK